MLKNLTTLFLLPVIAFANPYFSLLTGSAGTTGYSATIIASAPLVYYRLDEASGPNTTDSSGNAHTGTYTTTGAGSITYSVTPGGVTGNNAVTFTPSTGAAYIDTGIDAAANPAGDFSLECWVKVTGTGTYIAIGKYNGGVPAYWVGVNNGKVNFSVANALNGTVTAASTASVNDNAWHYIAGVRDGTVLRIYIDGSADGIANFTNGGSVSPLGNLMVARFGAGATFYFPGSLDEAAVYMAKLTATDVSNHYAARTSP